MMDNVIVIGIAGGTGCGKSTMINRIKEEFSEKITIISMIFITSSTMIFRLKSGSISTMTIQTRSIRI